MLNFTSRNVLTYTFPKYMTGMFVAGINFVNLFTWAKTHDQMTGDKLEHVRLYILLFYLFTFLVS